MVPRAPSPADVNPSMPEQKIQSVNIETVEDQVATSSESMTPSRPGLTERRVTSPDSPNSLSSLTKPSSTTLPLRHRNHSPYTRAHMRSLSSNSPLAAPQMTRAHSSPVPDAGRSFSAALARPSSPTGPLARRRSPLRRASDESYPSYGGQIDIGQTISEENVLDLTLRPTTEAERTQTSPTHYTFPRIRRRPSSPLHQITQAGSPHELRSSSSSPSLAATRFINEPYPSTYSFSSFSSSSIPSTPTSFRSRSPSISSLETIPDSPDAEIEAENIARLKAAADSEGDSEGEEGTKRRGSLSGALRDKRKRWSVCGAERRGDLDLETIWED